MKIAILHSAANGFFPRFYISLRQPIIDNGDCCKLFVPNIKTNRLSNLPDKCIWGTRVNTVLHHLLYRITGLQDIFSFFDTLILLVKIRKFQPDIIHCNIINNQCLNIFLFSNFVNYFKIPIIWTMHDCRAITGRCAFFDEIGCNRWKSGCGKCPQQTLYEPTWIDSSHIEWKVRKKNLTSINNLTIVTPSQWLAEVISSSFLKHKICTVIHNGIDIDAFHKPYSIHLPNYNLNGKIIVLGIASAWEKRKGLDVFTQLAKDLTEPYQIILVGNIPYHIQNIISIPRTNSTEEIIALYNLADVFVNPTIADNFPTTNIEALAAGIPVVTYNSGGSGEAIDANCGIIVERGNYGALLNAIIEITSNRNKYTKENCQKKSQEFSLAQFNQYHSLYQNLLK